MLAPHSFARSAPLSSLPTQLRPLATMPTANSYLLLPPPTSHWPGIVVPPPAACHLPPFLPLPSLPSLLSPLTHCLSALCPPSSPTSRRRLTTPVSLESLSCCLPPTFIPSSLLSPLPSLPTDPPPLDIAFATISHLPMPPLTSRRPEPVIPSPATSLPFSIPSISPPFPPHRAATRHHSSHRHPPPAAMTHHLESAFPLHASDLPPFGLSVARPPTSLLLVSRSPGLPPPSFWSLGRPASHLPPLGFLISRLGFPLCYC